MEGILLKLLYDILKIIINAIIYLIASSITLIIKAINIIKPQTLKEWIILIIAIPFPFGVTALWIYKFTKNETS